MICTFCFQRHVIVLEEEVIPGRDFLNFLSQFLDVIDTDSTLMGVGAWNANGKLCASTKHGSARRDDVSDESLGLLGVSGVSLNTRATLMWQVLTA